MRDINRIVVHHSESEGGDREFIRYLHVDRNGWQDIGYHAIITNGLPNGNWKAGGDGEIQEGRPEKMQGAHARGHNEDSLGVCLIGRFDSEVPTHAQISALVKLLLEWCEKYDLDETDIFCHDELNNTDCPGHNLRILMPVIKSSVRIWLTLKHYSFLVGT